MKGYASPVRKEIRERVIPWNAPVVSPFQGFNSCPHPEGFLIPPALRVDGSLVSVAKLAPGPKGRQRIGQAARGRDNKAEFSERHRRGTIYSIDWLYCVAPMIVQYGAYHKMLGSDILTQ